MKRNILKYLACAAIALGLGTTVQAAQINGSIGFTGTFTQNGGTQGSLDTATSFSIVTVAISSTTGDLVGSGAPIVFASPIGVNSNPPTLVGATLWSVLNGAKTFTFMVTTEAQTLTSGIQVNLAGTGIMKDGTVADATAGVWQIGFGATGASFTWQSTSATNIPDGGTTVALLGAALSGLALIRRKLA